MNKTIRSLLLALVVGLMNAQAHASDEDVVGVHVATYHVNREAGFNEANPGIYYKHHSGATVGAYYNSEKKVSAYIGYTKEWSYVGATIGVVSGYSDITPFLIPFVKIGYGFRLAYLPQNPASKINTQAIHLMKDF